MRWRAHVPPSGNVTDSTRALVPRAHAITLEEEGMHTVLRFGFSLVKFVLLNLVVSVALIAALHIYFYNFG